MAIFQFFIWSSSLFLILLLSMVNGFLPYPIEAEVTPIDLTIEDGDSVILNCTLTDDYKGPYNASDIYFQHGGQPIQYPLVHALTDRIAQLQLTNMTVALNGLYVCTLPGKTSLGLHARTNIHIAKRPLKPVVEGCIVHNWEEMRCRFSPSKEEQEKHMHAPNSFNQTLFWNQSGDGDIWHAFPNVSETFVWPHSSFMNKNSYCLQLNATNILSRTVSSDITCFNTEDNVKPSLPLNLRATFTDGLMNISWEAPISRFNYSTPLDYILVVQTSWGAVTHRIPETSKALSSIPFTKYNVVLSVRPRYNGYASDNISSSFYSPETVPCKNPSTLANAYYLSHADSSHRKIVLYWQAINVRDYCGSGFGYQIRARTSSASGSNDTWIDIGPLTRNSSVAVELNNSIRNVAIFSRNSVGFSDKRFTVIHVPSVADRQLSSDFELVIEGEGRFASVHWFNIMPVKNVTNFTLFWCRYQSPLYICQSDIQWQILEFADQEYNLTFENDLHRLQFGLAVHQPEKSLGITWATQHYSLTANAEPPREVMVKIPNKGHPGEIMVRWTPPLCNKDCAFVRSFSIYYCLIKTESVCQGEVQSMDNLSRITEYLLTGLDHGSTYKVWMKSVSRNGPSRSSESFTVTTTAAWVTTAAIAGILIASLVVGAVVIYGLYATLRYCSKYKKKFLAGPAIKLPPAPRVLLSSTSSEAPILVNQTTFNYYYRQQSRLSTVSGDSGHFSLGLGPGSPAMLPLLTKEVSNSDHHLEPISNQSMMGSFETTKFSELDETSSHRSTEKSEDEDGGQNFIVTYSIVGANCPVGKETCSKQPGLALDGDTTKDTIYLNPDDLEKSKPLSEKENSYNMLAALCDNNNITATQCDKKEDPPDIGYTKIDQLMPFFGSSDQCNSQTFGRSGPDLLVDLQPAAEADASCLSTAVPMVGHLEELLANLRCHPDTSVLQVNEDRVTNDRNHENKLPDVDDSSLVCTYTVLASASNPDLTCSDGETRVDKPGPVSWQPCDYGYIDHGHLLGVGSIN